MAQHSKIKSAKDKEIEHSKEYTKLKNNKKNRMASQ
jgi:hypothetical protein